MSDFLSFLQKMEREKERPDVVESVAEVEGNADPQKMAEQAFAAYAGKSEAELMSELEKEIARRKAEGGISRSEIDGFASMLMPFLGEEQQVRLRELLKMLG